MKVNVVFLLIALAVSALAGYGFYAANDGELYRPVITIGGGLSLFIPLAGLLALNAGGRGGAVHIKVVSTLFFAVLLIEQAAFSFLALKLAPYIIITGILLLVYVLIGYALAHTGE
ncbi:MAG: hypothetical protein LBP69_08215 [Treponema sp.]|jgi:hypothetical protein|nr:hypothetical protein [Treponema sp.]